MDGNDNVLEDIGIIHDNVKISTKADLQNGTDRVINYAIEYIKKKNKSVFST